MGPLLLASLVLSGLGAMQTARGVDEQQDAITSSFMQEMQRQDEYQNKSKKAFDPALANQGKDQQDAKLAEMEDGTKKRYQGHVKTFSPADYLPGQARSEVTAGAVQRGTNQAAAAGMDEAARRAALDAYVDLNLRNKIDLGHSADEIGLYSDFAGGSQRTNQIELAAAQQQGGGKKSMGQFLSQMGQAAGTAAAFGGGPTFGQLGADVKDLWGAFSNPGVIANPNIPGASYLLS